MRDASVSTAARSPPWVRTAREDAVGELAQLGVRALCLLDCLAHELGRKFIVRLERLVRVLQSHDGHYQALLGSVVQVAHHAPALVVGRRHDASTGRRHLGPGLGVRDRRRDQLGEVLQARLGLRRQ